MPPPVTVRLRSTADPSYTVQIEGGLLRRLPRILAGSWKGASFFLISDETVSRLSARDVHCGLVQAGCQAVLVTFPDGERSKTAEMLNAIHTALLSLGLGLPFVVLALASGSIQHLPRSGEWMEWVKHLFGVILLGMAVYFLRFLPWFPDAGRKWIYLVLALLAALYLGFLTRSGNASGRFRAFKVFAVLVFAGAASWLLLAGEARGPVWAPYSEDALRGAVKAGRPVAIDFTAEWCIPCKEMEATTFRDPRVVEVLRRFVLLRADMTSETRATKALADRWAYKINRQDLPCTRIQDCSRWWGIYKGAWN